MIYLLDFWKDPDAGKDWGQDEKGTTEDEMAGWHHQLSGREFEWTPGVGDGQGGVVCSSPWGQKESDTTERLNWTYLIQLTPYFGTSLVAQMVKRLPAIRETQVWSLGWEDFLEKEMATHSSIPAWRIPGMESPVGDSPWGRRVRHDWATSLYFTPYFHIYE